MLPCPQGLCCPCSSDYAWVPLGPAACGGMCRTATVPRLVPVWSCLQNERKWEAGARRETSVWRATSCAVLSAPCQWGGVAVSKGPGILVGRGLVEAPGQMMCLLKTLQGKSLPGEREKQSTSPSSQGRRVLLCVVCIPSLSPRD